MRPTRSQRRSHSCILFRPRAEQLEPRAMLSIEPTLLLAEFSTVDVAEPSIDHFETARGLVFFNVNDSELWVTDESTGGNGNFGLPIEGRCAVISRSNHKSR